MMHFVVCTLRLPLGHHSNYVGDTRFVQNDRARRTANDSRNSVSSEELDIIQTNDSNYK